MDKYHRSAIFGLVALVAIYTTGCNRNMETPESEIVATVTVSENTLTTETTYNFDANESLQHFVETVNENFHIDAVVKEYPKKGTAGVYIGEPKRINKEEIQRFIDLCGTKIASSQEINSPDMYYYNGVCENGAVFYAEQDTHNHPYSKFLYRNDEKCRFYHAYPIYTGEEEYLTNTKYTVGWMFAEPKDLSFGSALEAEQCVRTALARLGLVDLKLLRTLYCDHETLAAAMQRITTHQDYGPLGAAVENNGYPIKEIWTEEDDAYMFSFGLSVHDIPMSYRYFDSSRTAWYTGSEIVVWYTKDGIVNLIVNTPWQVRETETPPTPIISAQAALDVAKTKLEYDLIKNDKSIEEIRLEYHYVQDRGRWLLMPVWAVACSSRSGPDTDRVYTFVHVDALTGNEL